MEKEMIYDIPAFNINWLKKKVTKLNQRGKRLKCEPIKMVELKRFERPIRDSFGFDTGARELIVRIELIGTSPKINGWSFLGTIQHTDAGNILRVIKETDIPEDYRSVKRACDHCQKDRNRKDTYLVQHENGAFKQLGKSCLKDYTGHMSVRMLGHLAIFAHELGKAQDEEMEKMERWEHECPPDIFLRNACEAIVLYGSYVTSKQATGGLISTADAAWNSIFPPKGKEEKFALPKTEDGEKLFEGVTKTVAALEGKKLNDFEHNVFMLSKNPLIQYRSKGILAAAILIHERELVKKLEFDNNKDRGWVGEPKKRQEWNLTIEKIHSFDSFYGVMQIIKMRDEDSNIIVWKTGTGLPNYMDIGAKFKAKATVKEHTTYNDIKQTIITRLKVLEESAEEVAAC